MSKTYLDDKGYYRFKGSSKLVHRWVAYRYIYNKHAYFYPFSAYVVHHKDGNKENNNVDNLKILAQSEHRKIHGIHGQPSQHCFIATAAYGTPFEEEIQILRNWRDNYLEKNKIGNFLVKFYYWFSPSIANIIRDNDCLRKITRALLNPIVKYLKKFYA
jgi:hypothetical protein